MIIYGMGGAKLSRALNIPVEKAKALIKGYLGTMKRVRKHKQNCENAVRYIGYTETVFGRRRYFNKAYSGLEEDLWAAFRESMNHTIQGTCADIIKIAMIKIGNMFRDMQLKSLMILQVHDELVFDIHPDEIDIVPPLVVKHMQEAASFTVPMEVGADMGLNWGEAH